MLDEVTRIVDDFFDKWDERRNAEKKIKHTIIEQFSDPDLARPVIVRFMELAKTKFKNKNS